MSRALLEVAVTSDRDVAGAVEGGADRLFLSVPQPGEPVGTSPDLAAASPVLRESPVPVRVLLRLGDTYTTTGGEFARLVGLAEEYLTLGAEGVCFGFLDADLEVDAETCRALAGALPSVPWTFSRAVDATLDARRSWRRLVDLPGLSAVSSGGSPRGLAQGYDDLLALAEGSPSIASPADAQRRAGRRAGAVARGRRGPPAPGRRAGAARRLGEGLRRRSAGALLADAPRQRGRPGRRPGRRMILIDPPQVAGYGRLWSHLASDTSYDELHAFARAVGIPAARLRP